MSASRARVPLPVPSVPCATTPIRSDRRFLMRATYNIALALLCYLALLGTHQAVADTIHETEPNDTPATANPTVGVNTLVVLGELSPIGDQDYFTFVVTDLGQPVPNHPAVVRIDAGFTTEIFSKPY